jgi:hypothetical protein
MIFRFLFLLLFCYSTVQAQQNTDTGMRVLHIVHPLKCRYGSGTQWIRQWGDGALPPEIPICVNADSTKIKKIKNKRKSRKK